MSARRDEVAAWIDRAETDLAAARILREQAGPAVVACFLCQQACEKLLKALLVEAGIEPPRTHDLADLLRRVRAAGRPVDADEDRLDEWTAYAVASRYPGFGDPRAEDDLPSFFAFVESLARAARAAADAQE
jgi:HEPN domain-containing protein